MNHLTFKIYKMKYLLILATLSLARAATLPELLSGVQEFVCPPEAGSGGLYPHETACEKYYICDNGVAKEYTCNTPLLFDLTYLGCNFPYLTDCGDRIRPNGTMYTTVPPPPTGDPNFDCPAPGGAFPHPEFCELYYVCVENAATLNKCKDEQLFDLKYDGCNFDLLVDCGDRKRPNGSASTVAPVPTRDPGDFECPTPGGAFPHPLYCEYYYLCVSNEPSLEKCPDFQVFDLLYNGCNWYDLVDCGDRGTNSSFPTKATTTTTTKKPPGTGPTDGPEFECPGTGLYADPYDCTSYYNCDGTIGSHVNCPPNLYFNDVVKVCDFKANVDCGTRPIPSLTYNDLLSMDIF